MNNNSSFLGKLQIQNNGPALPVWHLSWTYKAGETLGPIAANASGGTGTNAIVYSPSGNADIYGFGDNAGFRGGDSLKSSIWLTGTWTTSATKTTKPTGFSLNGRACSANIHGTRYGG